MALAGIERSNTREDKGFGRYNMGVQQPWSESIAGTKRNKGRMQLPRVLVLQSLQDDTPH